MFSLFEVEGPVVAGGLRLRNADFEVVKVEGLGFTGTLNDLAF